MSEPDADVLPVEGQAPPEAPPTTPVARPQPRRVNLDALTWALALMWAGGVLLLANLGGRTAAMPWGLPLRPGASTLLFAGLAGLMTISVVVRLAVSAYRHNIVGYIVLDIVFVALAVGRVELMWPIILIVVGVALLIRHRQW